MKLQPGRRVFCSYAYTGEDKTTVERRMNAVLDVFHAAGLETYCIMCDERTAGFTNPGQYIRLALREVKNSDVVFALKSSERRSEGQLLEIGAALALDIPVIYAQHESSIGNTYVDTLAEHTFLWQNEGDLPHAIRALCTQRAPLVASVK